MPAFLEFGEFYRWDNPEVWVAIGLILFIAILWVSGAFKTAFGFLDKKALTIKTDLEEAARLRAEAEAMLADIRQQRDDAEAQGAAMLEEARAEAERLAAEAKVKLEESIARRKALAERRIATAEAQALAEVKAAAADLAAQVAEVVLADRVKGLKSDPQVDHALGQLADRLQ